MESCNIELVSNASAQLFPDNTQSSFRNFLPEKLNLEGQWEVAISETSYPSMYQNVTEGNLRFLTRKFQSHQNSITWNLVFNPSITDIVEAMNTLIQKRHNHGEGCIPVSVAKNAKS